MTESEIIDLCRDVERLAFGDDLTANTPDRIVGSYMGSVYCSTGCTCWSEQHAECDICHGDDEDDEATGCEACPDCNKRWRLSFDGTIFEIPDYQYPGLGFERLWEERDGKSWQDHLEQHVQGYRHPPRRFDTNPAVYETLKQRVREMNMEYEIGWDHVLERHFIKIYRLESSIERTNVSEPLAFMQALRVALNGD